VVVSASSRTACRPLVPARPRPPIFEWPPPLWATQPAGEVIRVKRYRSVWVKRYNYL
jgi:hypothetical protein